MMCKERGGKKKVRIDSGGNAGGEAAFHHTS